MRPYYNDPYTVEFEAEVIHSEKTGDGYSLVLNKSYFYPTSGGQEHDTGVIGGVQVTDVVDVDDRVCHIVSDEPPEGKVVCRIDWLRRFSNMQQHTGQHMLSAAFENLFEIETVSSRLGEYAGTIDLSRQPTDGEIEEAVRQVNCAVQEDRPVKIHFAEKTDIAKFNLRKPPKVDGTVRIVEVQDFDTSPCGGTHCTHTSEIGVVVTGSIEKVKGSLTRIEFYCGGRAVKRYYEIYEAAREASRLISSSIQELPAAVDRLKNQIQEKDSTIKAVTGKMLEDLCEKIGSSMSQDSGIFKLVDLSGEVRNIDDLRFVSSCVARKTSSPFAFYRIDGNISYMNVSFPTDESAANELLNELRQKCNAKGGGRNGFFSITFEKEKLEEIASLINQRSSVG